MGIDNLEIIQCNFIYRCRHFQGSHIFTIKALVCYNCAIYHSLCSIKFLLQLCFDDIWYIPFIDLKTLVFEQLPNWTFIYIIKIKQIFDHKIKDGGTNLWDVKSG